MWWLNDSGNAPVLYRTDGGGALLETYAVAGAVNRDWEDLAAAPDGRVFIGDFGNNANRRQDLCIYILEQDGSLDSIRFNYPDQSAFPPPEGQWQFDMEGFFYHQDSLHLFSKDKSADSYLTKHYSLPARPGQYTANLRGQLQLPKRIVTGAAISPDGETVVLLAYRFKMLLGFFPLTPADIFVFRGYTGTDFLDGSMQRVRGARCLMPTQYEAIDFTGPRTVYIASERTPLFHQKAKRRKLPLVETDAQP
ncbi:MAG: hypothetical protein RIC19_16175 [Phaeodactylibacter sp.]